MLNRLKFMKEKKNLIAHAMYKEKRMLLIIVDSTDEMNRQEFKDFIAFQLRGVAGIIERGMFMPYTIRNEKGIITGLVTYRMGDWGYSLIRKIFNKEWRKNAKKAATDMH